MLPNATIDFFQTNDTAFRYMIANNYHIISSSIGNCFADNALEKKLAQNSLLIASAGNNSSNGENPIAKDDWWTSIGAYHLVDNKPELAYYSSYGFNAVDYMSFSSIQYKENSDIVCGTSYSNPFFVSLVAKYYEAYFNKINFYPTVDQAKHFIKTNSKPIINDKVKEGNGLLILPDFSTFNFGTVIGEKYGNKINANGTWRTTINPPMIVNNKLMVELTTLRECGGTNVFWNSQEKVAIVC
jgi:hypothetical protein